MSHGDWWQPADDLRCGLLVSVRDPVEAEEAVAGGATIIDVKEPDRGPLGRADAAVIAAVALAVGRRRPLTIAAGELKDGTDRILALLGDVLRLLPAGAARPVGVKAGLAGFGGAQASRDDMETMLGMLVAGIGPGIDSVAVSYVDWEAAAAPSPADVIAAAARHGCRGVLFDTFNKHGAGALQSPAAARLPGWIATARQAGLAVAVAGGIGPDQIPATLALRPDVVGFRSAACVGGRFGRISRKRVDRLDTLCRPSAAVPGGGTSGVRA